MIYGYCRISTAKQNIERQVRNITTEYPEAQIRQEEYTGTKVEGRKEFNKLLKEVKTGDTIVFDSVSRMSRNADDGVKLYFELLDKGVNIVFLKEHYIDTETYKDALQKQIAVTVDTGDNATDTFVNAIIEALNKYQMDLAERQIRIAFGQAEKEVQDLRQRTKEGIETARRLGKQIGQKQGKTLDVKKKEPMKAEIRKKAKDFGGAYSDKDLMVVLGLARNTYYRYKKELTLELQEEQNR